MADACDRALFPFCTFEDIGHADAVAFTSLSPSTLPPLFKNGLMYLRWKEPLQLSRDVPQVLHMVFLVVVSRDYFGVVDWLAYGALFPLWTVEAFLDSCDELVLAVCPFESGEVPAGHPFACLRCTRELPPPFVLPPWLSVDALAAAARRRRDLGSLKFRLLYLGLMQLMEGLLETTLLLGPAPKARLSRSRVPRVVKYMVGGSTNSSCFLCPIASCLFVFSSVLERRQWHGLVGFWDLFSFCFGVLHICTCI